MLVLSWILVPICVSESSESYVIAKDYNDEDSRTAMSYLMKYGYMEQRTHVSSSETVESVMSEFWPAMSSQAGHDGHMKSAVLDFQTFAGIKPTGELDPVTVKLMETPRCGVRDRGLGAAAKKGKGKTRLVQNNSYISIANYIACKVLNFLQVLFF